MMREIIFKLKHDIANDSELPLAAMEVAAIFGSKCAPVKNLADLLVDIDWLRDSLASRAESRIQDVFLRLPYPGFIQGYRTDSAPETFSTSQIARLTYFRDIFVVFSGEPSAMLANLGLH